jgi:hypothetical protein
MERRLQPALWTAGFSLHAGFSVHSRAFVLGLQSIVAETM